MKMLYRFITDYFSSIHKGKWISITLFTAVLVFINFHFKLDEAIRKNNSFSIKLFYWYIVFLAAFAIPYFLNYILSPSRYYSSPRFLFLVCFAPVLFALKLTADLDLPFPGDQTWHNYWNHIFYWPALLALTGTILFFIWKKFDRDQPFYGLKKNVSLKPYFILLLLMIPLVAAASTQPDFLAVYPKLKSITEGHADQFSIGHKLLFELSYGSDFINIELFFRGFLLLAFVKWFGQDAILPMACFYCTIHFGKPLGECISSYFGGMILGIIVYNTRSIYGGLLIHLGVAWLMELGGYLGNLIIK